MLLVKSVRSDWISYLIFFPTLAIVIYSLVPAIFPALILSQLNPFGSQMNAFEIGPMAIPLLAINIFLLGLGICHARRKLPETFYIVVKFIKNFEISQRITLLAIISLLSIYIGFTIQELLIEEYWVDIQILEDSLKIWPFGESDDRVVKEFSGRHVSMSLHYISQNIFGNIKLLPFIASILLLILTYFFTSQLTKRRFAGIISMVVLAQSYIFLRFDTNVVYTNFWILLYLLSLYVIQKRGLFSAPLFFLSIFTKPIILLFLPINILFILKSKAPKQKKSLMIISYAVIVGITFYVVESQENIYEDMLKFNSSNFWLGLTDSVQQLRFDGLIMMTILPLVVSLFFISKNGIREADLILILILGSFLMGPLLYSISAEYLFLMPYRFMTLVVFFAIGVGLLFAKKPLIQGSQNNPS